MQPSALDKPTDPQVYREARPDYTLLTISRFFAALWVVFLHLYILMPAGLQSSSFLSRNPMFKLGFLGVTFFFVLSGFILGKLYPGKVNKESFYLKRFLRIYPSYFIVLAVLVAIPILEFPRTIAYCAPVFLLFNAWIPSASQNLLGPAWSLTCEAFFYLIYPFVSKTILRKDKSISLPIIVLTFVPTVVGLLMASGHGGFEYLQNSRVVFFPLVHVPSFLVGILFSRIKLMPGKTALVSLATIFFILAVKLVWKDDLPFQMGIMALPFAALIWALAGERQPDARGTVTSFLLLLGNARYVLYLVHLPILLILQKLGHLDTRKGFIIAPLIAVGFSIIFYVFVDRPIHNRASQWIANRRKISQS